MLDINAMAMFHSWSMLDIKSMAMFHSWSMLDINVGGKNCGMVCGRMSSTTW